MVILALIFYYITIVSLLNLLIWLFNDAFDIFSILVHRDTYVLKIISGYNIYLQISDSIMLFGFYKKFKPLYKIGQDVWILDRVYVASVKIIDISFRGNRFYYIFSNNQSRYEDIISPVKLDPVIFTKEHIQVINNRKKNIEEWLA